MIMETPRKFCLVLLCCSILGCNTERTSLNEIEPQGPGPHPVGSTNMAVAPEFADIGDEAMHEFLLGRPDESGNARFVIDILKYPDSAWIVDVPVPDDRELYGPASGESLPVVAFLTWPAGVQEQKNSYAFPYHDAMYGVFEDMLGPGDTPVFADPDKRYPLIILAHGSSAHGIYDVRHAHNLASQGFIVAVITCNAIVT